MFKTILLKLAHSINKHYKTTEIQLNDKIKYKEHIFCITSIDLEVHYMGTSKIIISADNAYRGDGLK